MYIFLRDAAAGAGGVPFSEAAAAAGASGRLLAPPRPRERQA